jgi:SAM-dependent methyltransferase
MINNFNEYKLMYQVENQHWWYKVLHEKVLTAIQSKYNQNKEIKILDAGCGTGGLLDFLSKNGYKNIQGFDFSMDAVNFCKQRNLKVQQIDILDFETYFDDFEFDVIINNDVYCQFENFEITDILKNFEKKLHSNGVLISNNNAFEVFYGTHDIIVGSKKRFKKIDFQMFTQNLDLKIEYANYWSLFLSPLILTVRLLHRLKLKLGLVDLKNLKSDIALPSNFVNRFLYKIVKIEEKILKNNLFGSSIFLIFTKQK